MDNNEIVAAVKSTALFSALSENELCLISDNICIHTKRKGEHIKEKPGINVILRGEAFVTTPESDRIAVLNKLKEGCIFGFASLFAGQNAAATDIRCAGDLVYIHIAEDTIEAIAAENGRFALNIIKILSGKIRFLSTVIDRSLSCGISGRVYKYLLSLRRNDRGEVIEKTSMTSISSALGIGRASVYRAVDELEKSGKIARFQKQFIINNK